MAFIYGLIKPRWSYILLSVIPISISLTLHAIKPFSERSTAWEKSGLSESVGHKAGRAVNTGKDHPWFWLWTLVYCVSVSLGVLRQSEETRLVLAPCETTGSVLRAADFNLVFEHTTNDGIPLSQSGEGAQIEAQDQWKCIMGISIWLVRSGGTRRVPVRKLPSGNIGL